MESIRRYRSSITVVSISASPSLVWIRKLPTQVFPTYQTLGATRNGSMATFQGMVLALFTVSIGVTFTSLLMIVIIPFFFRPAAPAGHSFIIFYASPRATQIRTPMVLKARQNSTENFTCLMISTSASSQARFAAATSGEHGFR